MALKPGQLKCIETLDKPLVVAAGAGSGKTFTLTKRIVHALESGYVSDIDEVLAITFTKKAAGELKSRVKQSLRAAGKVDQALKVDEAWISTIHGMCARILRAHAVQLGIDPSFTVAEDEELRLLRAQAVDDALREMQASEPARVRQLFSEYAATSGSFGRGASVSDMLVKLMELIAAAPEEAAAFDLPSGGASSAQQPAALLDCIASLAQMLLDSAALQGDSASQNKFMAQTQQAISAARAAMDGEALDAQGALRLASAFPVKTGFGGEEFKEQAKETTLLMQQAAFQLRLLAAQPLLDTLVQLASRAAEILQQQKMQQGLLSNDDLLGMASKAIAQHSDIAQRYVNKFKLIMIDEFQDTDQLQIDMVKRFAGEGGCRLCTVGDAQQSIYRFRGADVSVYRRHLAQVRTASEEGIILLPDNFRSHPDVLSFVDRVFERDAMFGHEFMSLAPARIEAEVRAPYKGTQPRIAVQHVSYSSKGGTAAMRQASAQGIAAKFAALVREGHSAGDMVILLGAMANADVYAQAVRDAGLPCVVTGGSILKSTPEAAHFVELVQWLANPHQTEQLFNVLAGPFFGVLSSDLLELGTKTASSQAGAAAGAAASSQAGNASGTAANSQVGSTAGAAASGALYRRDLDEGLAVAMWAMRNGEVVQASPQLRSAVRVLGAALSRVGKQPLSAITRDVLTDSGLLWRLQCQGAEGQAKAANYYKLMRLLQGAEDEFGYGAAASVQYFANSLARAKESPGALSAAGGNFVRIMSVHISKGLEFPIVAVAEMRAVSAPSDRLLCGKANGRIYASLDLGTSLNDLSGAAAAGNGALDALLEGDDIAEDEYAALIAAEQDPVRRRALLRAGEATGDAEEAKRLLYVALTRAKEALIVASFGNRTKEAPNGTPKTVLAAVGPALTGGDDWFAPGVSHYDFGGMQPALVEHLALGAEAKGDKGKDAAGEGATATDAAAVAASTADAGNTAASTTTAEEETFFVPVPRDPVRLETALYRPDRAEVFSYSSIAEASHTGDILNVLAASYALEPDGLPLEGDDASFVEALDEGFSFASGAPFDASEDNWFDFGPERGDEDKATDLGTAFHRLAQYAALHRGPAGELAMPPAARFQALARSCRLGASAQVRLQQALNRWFESNVAQRMAAFGDLAPEVPFFVDIERAGKAPIFLEGEIDLLAAQPNDAGGKDAFVVDYKTGGKPTETAEQLASKHVLQAACYAYALIRQGFASVEASFVRVEQRISEIDNEPQVVRYRFTTADEQDLENAIVQVFGQAQQAKRA